MWSIYVPTESQVFVYHARHIFTFKTPNFSRLSPGVNLSNEAPMWYWPGPDLERIDQCAWTHVFYMAGDALYDPPSAREFNLHYFCRESGAGSEPIAITVTIPINDFASKATEPPALRRKSTPIPYHQKDSVGFSYQMGGLHSEKAFQTEGFDILVTRLGDLILEGLPPALQMSVTYQDLKYHPGTIEMDMDEATGRVIIWGWDKDAYEMKIFIGDLV